MPDLRALLADGHVHVSDGAMGTLLYSKGIFLNVCYDELNLRQPDVIRDIHRDYVRAGATIAARPAVRKGYKVPDAAAEIPMPAEMVMS